MCGIVGDVGGRSAAAEKAGTFARVRKELSERPLPAGITAVGHTRWATHGPPTDAHTPPHPDDSGRVAVVHDGTMENFAKLRADVAGRGPAPASEQGPRGVVVAASPRGRSLPRGRDASRLQEIRARGPRVVVAEVGDTAVRPYADHLIEAPPVPTLPQPPVATAPLRTFACESATSRGNEVDRPRDPARSVTWSEVGAA